MRAFYIISVFFSFLFLTVYNASGDILQDHIDKGRQAYLDTEMGAIAKPDKQGDRKLSYEVGDTKSFWRYDLSHMPPSWIQETGYCFGVGEHAYIFVSEDEFMTLSEQDVETILGYLDNATLKSEDQGIIEMLEENFGDIPDALDNDPKAIIYYTALGQYQGSVFDGYFSPFNQMTETEAVNASSHSNECEMVYMSCNPVDPTSLASISVLAHELQHLISFDKDPDEDQWINEGCSQFAMALFGNPDPITGYQLESNNNLLEWDKSAADYSQVLLFFTFMAEHYGGSELIRKIVAEAENGPLGINNALEAIGKTEKFADILNNFMIANYINDKTYMDGLYSYEAITDMPQFALKRTYGDTPVEISGVLKGNACYYYKLPSEFVRLKCDLDVNGAMYGNLICYEGNEIKEIKTFKNGESFYFDYPEEYELSKVIFVLTNFKEHIGEDNFTLNISDETGVRDISIDPASLKIFPNPFNESLNIEYSIDTPQNLNVCLYNIYGEKALILDGGYKAAGVQTLSIESGALPSGTYFLRVEAIDGEIVRKIELLR